MKQQGTKGTAQPSPAWEAEGAEASAVLGLARSVDATPPDTEERSAQWFAATYRDYSAVQERRRGMSSSRRLYYAGAFAVAAAVAGLFMGVKGLPWRHADDALSYRVKSGASVGRLIESKSDPIELAFSDGTIVSVEPDTRAMVSETTHRGARFRLNSGRMHFNVVPHADRGEWLVEAGAFQVRVTGTIFTVEWIAAEGAFRVDVERGHVVVTGAGQRRELGPGDSFHHREKARQTADAARAEEGPAMDVSELPLAPSSAPGAASGSADGTAWSELVAAGRFSAVLDAAGRRGVDRCLDSCTQDDLRALADAARLGGKPSVAERALLAQRSRFAGSADAAAAAFLLGRSAEQRHDARAVSWYDSYLAEAPRGRFAQDALGRKMLLVASSDGAAGVALAREYLARFPGGPYSGHAKSLIEAKGGQR